MNMDQIWEGAAAGADPRCIGVTVCYENGVCGENCTCGLECNCLWPFKT